MRGEGEPGVNRVFAMLSTTTEYALRALTFLARTPHGQAVLGRELAERTGIPAKYLAKVMLSLRNAGLVAATRGTGGGYCLLRSAEGIYLMEVVEIFEGGGARPQCLLGINAQCSEAHPCTAHPAWRDVRRGYIEFLEATTVQEIAHPAPHEPGRVRKNAH